MASVEIPSGLHIEYETFGRSDDPALVLVSGFTAQLVSWDPEFCNMLAATGRYVIRFDNRDCGLSTKLDGQMVNPQEVIAAAIAGEPLPPVPYTLSDMADDAVGLLDALQIRRAHVAGASMGGMIVQTLAIEHPDRLVSATSIMSTVGDPEYGQAQPEAIARLLAPPPTNRDEAVELGRAMGVWSSKRYFDPDVAGERVGAAWDRSPYTEGGARQLAAIYASGDRSEALRSVGVPMLVIHGLDDTLIGPSGGRRTAELVPDASLLEVADMGHDLPMPLFPLITGAIVGFQQVATTQGGAS